MGARSKLLLIIASALLLASVVSHVLTTLFGIHTKGANGYKRFGPSDGAAQALICGPSLTYDAIDWKAVASRLGLAIESWPVPGSSAAEWEYLQRRSPQVKTTFVGVSPYDLNEAWLCDFRADIVPLGQTVKDLWRSGSYEAFSKRVLSCYPRLWVRKLFPTVGRSQAVMSGLHEWVRRLLRREASEDSNTATRLRLAADYMSDGKISAWPRGRLLRRLSVMRNLCQGRHLFSGPKNLALVRLLERATIQGSVIVIVLPVSPPYATEPLSKEDIRRFEAALAEASRSVPAARWVRLD